MNNHINKKRIIKFDWQKYLVKLFDNSLVRLYLGVPKGKHIYKITKSSIHYYTGEIDKNGLPIICTGDCYPAGQIIFNKILKLSKVFSCIAFLPFLPKTLLPLIALTDTGVKYPSAYSQYSSQTQWNNPQNAYADDGNYATATAAGNSYNFWSGFNLGLSDGYSINGIELKHKTKLTGTPSTYVFRVYMLFDVGPAYNKTSTITTTETVFTLGSSTDVWGIPSPTGKMFNDYETHTVMVQSYQSDGSETYLNYISLKVYYTEAVGPSNLKSLNTNLKANIKTINTNAIANVKSLDTNV